jgi:TolB-like protein
VRASGPMLRVAEEADSCGGKVRGLSETHDRQFDDILNIQNDIAGGVTKALQELHRVRAEIKAPI